jgi:hypothetical protein
MVAVSIWVVIKEALSSTLPIKPVLEIIVIPGISPTKVRFVSVSVLVDRATDKFILTAELEPEEPSVHDQLMDFVVKE